MKINKGFTLIEVMIVVTIVAILAAIAVPAYQEQIRKGKRSDAKQALLAASEAVERYKAANFTYKLGAAGTSLSSVFATQVPVDGGTAYYTLKIESNATSYKIFAEDAGSMDGDGDLTINQAGVKTGPWDK